MGRRGERGNDRRRLLEPEPAAPRYAEVSGRDLAELDFYVAFGFWKLACIVEGVYARYLGGALGDRDPAELAPFATKSRPRSRPRPSTWNGSERDG